jgi:hypothetical protein
MKMGSARAAMMWNRNAIPHLFPSSLFTVRSTPEEILIILISALASYGPIIYAFYCESAGRLAGEP